MARTYAAITGVHGYVPDFVLTNADLEKMVDTNDEWIRTRTGIKERRILKEPGKATSDMAVEAVKGLLEKTGTGPDEIDMVICGTVTADMHFPDTANIVADKVGMKNAFCFDLNAACSSFLFSLVTASHYMESGRYQKIVVIGADKLSAVVDYTDRSTCILFGDGAAAVLLEPSEEPLGVVDYILRSDGSGRELLYQKGGGSLYPCTHETVDKKMHYIYQDGRKVFKYAVEGMKTTVLEVMQRNGLQKDDISWLVPHQANMRIIEYVAKMAEFPMERVMINIDKYGNTTSATIPLCLWNYEDQLKEGDNLILTAFGGGFSWGSILVKWGKPRK